jgi:hypothetical protein
MRYHRNSRVRHRRPLSRGKRRLARNSVGELVLILSLIALAAWKVAPQLRSGSTLASTPRQQVMQVEESAYYPNCAAARSAGVAPISRGQPGYREGLDGDDDGVACEPYRGY